MTKDSFPHKRSQARPAPFRNIPFSIVVDGIEVHGLITYLHPNDMTVEITQPVEGLYSCLHIPYFAMGVHAVATAANRQTVVITDYGRKSAEWLLTAIYNHSRGLNAGWGVYDVQTHARRTQIVGIRKGGK